MEVRSADALVSGSRFRKSWRALGASRRTSRSVGLRSRATGLRSWKTGRASSAKPFRRSRVRRPSFSKVGRILKVSERAWLCEASAPNVRLPPDDRPGQGLVVGGERREHVARVVDQRAQRLLLAAQGSEDVTRVGCERAEVAEGVVQVEAAAVDRDPRVLHPGLERLPGLLVEALEDLVDLGLILDLSLGEMAAFRDRLRRVAARELADVDGPGLSLDVAGRLVGLGPGAARELDVGLAEQRLLAQDRLRVRGDRRVLRVDLDRRRGSCCRSTGPSGIRCRAPG